MTYLDASRPPTATAREAGVLVQGDTMNSTSSVRIEPAETDREQQAEWDRNDADKGRENERETVRENEREA